MQLLNMLCSISQKIKKNELVTFLFRNFINLEYFFCDVSKNGAFI